MTIPLDILMFAVMIGAILLGYPVALTIAGVAVIFAGAGVATGVFDSGLLGALGQRVFGVLTNTTLIAIPLFVFMGVVLEKSHVAEDLLEKMGRLFGPLRGGLGVSVVIVGALLAASTGIVGATVVAMGLIALPTMLRNGYDRKLASGIICTAGTLGQIIPPSTLLIILADVMSNAYQQAQYEEGKFSVSTLSVGQIFAAALMPGLLMVALYIIYLLVRAWWLPNDAPALKEKVARPSAKETLLAVVPPVLLIIAVLGSVLGGVATATEAASVGAVGALLLAGYRLGGPARLITLGALCFMVLAVAAGTAPVRLQRTDTGLTELLQGGFYGALMLGGAVALLLAVRQSVREGILKPVLTSTMVVTAMIFATILTASVFALVFVGLGGDKTIETILTAMPGGATGALIFAMALIFVLGFFLDFVEISVILLPLLAPPLILLGHDPLWLAVLIAINLQTSFLTPPFGFSLFYFRGAAPPEVTTGQIYRGVLPFICLQIVAVIIIWNIEEIATWLPSLLY